MKINSLSKAVLTAMLVSGTLATTTPIHAAAETSSAVTEVNTQQTTGADVQATIVTNDDGTKTVKVTIPADQAVDGSAKGGTFTATTNDDTDAEVDSGSVKQSKNKVKFNIELNKDALSNQKLLTEDLTITLADSKGNEIGKITDVTLQDLLVSSEDGVSESSSSKASSQSTNDSSTSSKAESASVKSESSDTKTSSSAQSDSDKTTGSSATSSSESGSKAESSSTTALAPDTPANDTATSTADSSSTSSSATADSGSAANTSSSSSSASSNSSSAPSSSSSSNSAANASSTGAADNGTLPQTSNDRNEGVVQSGVGIFGLISAAVAALGLRKRN